MNFTIDRFIHGGMLVLRETTSAREAARAMYERRVGSVVVCDHAGRMVGLVTDRDLSNQVLAFDYSADTPIGEIMSTDIFSITEDQSVADAIEIMKEHGIRRVPVVRNLESGKERCVGMVTLDDLIAEKAMDLETLGSVVSKQVLKPMRKRSGNQDRRDARAEHTLNRFYKLVAEHTRQSRPAAEEIAFYLLTNIVRRLPSTGAVQLISQLPSLLHEDLLTLRAGPNRDITASTLLSEIVSRFGLTPKEANETLEGFWDALECFTESSGETDQVLMQLPTEIRSLLS